MEYVIDVVAMAKAYAGGDGLKQLDLRVPAGTIVGLIGPSGAGKTTTIRLLSGLEEPDAGKLTVLGADPATFDTGDRARIGYLPQSTALYPSLSVRENVDFFAALSGLRGRRRSGACSATLEFLELAEVENRRVEDLSGGMSRRVGLAAALVHGPELLFLDEPTMGLDPILRKTVWEHLAHLRRDGRTVVVTTQYVAEAAYCDLVVLLSDGEVVESGDPEQLRRAAFGGELVDVVFGRSHGWGTIADLGERVSATDSRALGPRSVRFTVEDAGTAIPRLSDAAAENEIELAEVERHIPDFDEVFVRLMDRHRVREPVS